VLAAATFQYFRPLPVTNATSIVPTVQRIGTAPSLPWPAQGEAALFVDGAGEAVASAGNRRCRWPAPPR